MYSLRSTLNKLQNITHGANCTVSEADPWPSSVIGSKSLWNMVYTSSSTFPGDVFIISMLDNTFACGQEKKATLYGYCDSYIADYLTHGNITDMMRTLKIDIVNGINVNNAPLLSTQSIKISDAEVSSATGQSCSCQDCRNLCRTYPKKLVIKPFLIKFDTTAENKASIAAHSVQYPISATSGWTFCQKNPAPALFSQGPRLGPVLLHIKKFLTRNLPPVTDYRTALVTESGTRRSVPLLTSGCNSPNQPYSTGLL